MVQLGECVTVAGSNNDRICIVTVTYCALQTVCTCFCNLQLEIYYADMSKVHLQPGVTMLQGSPVAWCVWLYCAITALLSDHPTELTACTAMLVYALFLSSPVKL